MRRVLLSLVLSAVVVSLMACGSGQPPYRNVATSEELMLGMINPLAEIIFGSVAYIVTEAGVEVVQPANDEEWEQVVHAALALGEAGNLLLAPAHTAEREADWIEFTEVFVERALETAATAETQDMDALLEAGSILYESCTACHEVYLPEEELVGGF